MFFNAPNTPKNRIAAIIAIIAGLAVGFFFAVSGGKDKAEIAPIDSPETSVASSAVMPEPSAPPAPPKSLRLEDIDFTAYSQELARFTGLEIGQSRIEAIDTVRLYFAPQEGSNMIQTSQSIFERDDGSVMLYSAAGLPDDSVKAEEVYLILTGESGEQTLQSFGLRLKCYRGENTTNWQNTPCP